MRQRLLIGALAVVLLGGCSGAVTEPLPPSTPPTQVTVTGPPAHAAGPPMPARVPRRMMLPDIRATVVPAHLDGPELVPPADPKRVGWWGREAGAAHGTTLLVGHTVHDGGGALDDLEDVPVGAPVSVSGVWYTVTSNRVISKAALAERAPSLFGQEGAARLVVVTCEDYDWATGEYASNVVLVARPKYLVPSGRS